MKPRRVRPLLLVLLWIWAGCIALVLDLFWNVAEFDGVRPRAPLYRAMRSVAHEMVGEPLPGDVAPADPAANVPPAGPLLARQAADAPPASTGLEARVGGPEDPRIRAAILWALLRSTPDTARRAAQSRLDDEGETELVRAAATRALERIGGPPTRR